MIALIVALLIPFLGFITGLIKTYQAMMIYGKSDPQLISGWYRRSNNSIDSSYDFLVSCSCYLPVASKEVYFQIVTN